MKVNCPQCKASLNLPETAIGKMLRCPKCQTRFAAPPAPTEFPPTKMGKLASEESERQQMVVAARAASGATPPQSLAPPQQPQNSPRPLRRWIVLLVCGVLFVGLVTAYIGFKSSGILASKSSHMSLAEFKKVLLPYDMTEIGVTIENLYERVGEPEKIQMIGEYVYLYYHVKEGSVQVIGYKDYWENGNAESGAVMPGYVSKLPRLKTTGYHFISSPYDPSHPESAAPPHRRPKYNSDEPVDFATLLQWFQQQPESQHAFDCTIVDLLPDDHPMQLTLSEQEALYAKRAVTKKMTLAQLQQKYPDDYEWNVCWVASYLDGKHFYEDMNKHTVYVHGRQLLVKDINMY